MLKLKPISDSAWLILSKIKLDTIGLLAIQNGGKYVLLTPETKMPFDSRKAINDFFDTDVFETIEEPLAVIESVEALVEPPTYEVNADNPIYVDNKEDEPYANLVLFKKTDNGRVFCAGWFASQTKSSTTATLCPQLNTLKGKIWKGPFSTEDEAKSVASQLRSE